MNISLLKIVSPHSLFAVRIETYFDDIALATASSFAVMFKNKLYLVTNKHNFTGKDPVTNEVKDTKHCAIPNKIVAWFLDNSEALSGWKPLCFNLFSDLDVPLWIESTKNPSSDVALLEFAPRGISVGSISLDNYTSPINFSSGNKVHVLGFPLGKSSFENLPIWLTGFIATDTFFDFDSKPLFLIDCRTRKGNSGSPVFVHTGHTSEVKIGGEKFLIPELALLGVYSGRLDKESDLGMVWKTKFIHSILQSSTS